MWMGMDSYERWKSGFVSRPRMLDMTSERFSGLKTSAIPGIKAEMLKTEREVSNSELEVIGEAASWHGQRQTLKLSYLRAVIYFSASPLADIPFSCAVLLAAAIERLYDLNVGTTAVQEGAPHERPHKPRC